jgi:hypothetical protein
MKDLLIELAPIAVFLAAALGLFTYLLWRV